MGEPAIAVRGVTKRFRVFHERHQSLKAVALHRRRGSFEEFLALDDVSLEVAHGECVAFVGHNGSGKSTLLKCIAGILNPDGGTIATVGSISALLELGAGFHPELSGKENIFLNGALLGLSQRSLRSRVDDIVAFAGLEQFIDHPVKNYSSGMFARLGFAVAINVDPEILLIDEVLAVGDEQFQRRCMEKIYEMRTSGRTVVIVSHGLGILRTLCDRAAWLDHGKLKQCGPSGEVIDAYVEHTGLLVVTETPNPDVGMVIDAARLGTGELRVVGIDLRPADSNESALRTGSAATLRLDYHATSPVPHPIVGAAISRVDGVLVSATNTQIGGLELGIVRGSGAVELHIPMLPLLTGEYTIAVGVFDPTVTHTYDYRGKAYRFVVAPGIDRGTDGVITMAGSWKGAS